MEYIYIGGRFRESTSKNFPDVFSTDKGIAAAAVKPGRLACVVAAKNQRAKAMYSALSVSPFSSLPTKISPSIIPRRSDIRHLSYTFPKRMNEQPACVWAIPNKSQGKERSNYGVTMVDPLEAKRLAAQQLQEIQAKEKLTMRRRIEAINGAWAMIGLTAGLVIEGETGKSILSQLAGYLYVIFSFFIR